MRNFSNSHCKSGLLSLLAGFWLFGCVQLAVAADDVLEVPVLYVSREEDEQEPLSLLDILPENNGLAGAELGLNDNQTTGDFLGHKYSLDSLIVGIDDNLADKVQSRVNKKSTLIVADLNAADLTELADSLGSALLLNIRATDTRLREADCRANVLHIAPSRAMLADALIQYLAWKRWDKLVLVTGRHENDALYAQALERSVERFGLKMVERKNWTSVPGARRTDSGHHSLQQEVPVFSRFKSHDLVLVADETDEFGEYFAYRMTDPRPVAGTQGLIASAWHRTQEQWGATQIQRRFEKLASRQMTARDYGAWAALRSIAEAVTQTSTSDVETVRSYLLSDRFNLAGFKGVPLTFRKWNGQLRQPVLIVAPRMLVSVSPQNGFLHQVTELDTLGVDQPESACEQFVQ